MKKYARKPERLEEIGRQLVDAGVVTMGAGPEKVFRRSDDAMKATGALIEDVLRQADNALAQAAKKPGPPFTGKQFDWATLAGRFDAAADDLGIAGDIMAPELRKWGHVAAEHARKGAGYADAHKLKRFLGEATDFTGKDRSVENTFKKRIYGMVSEHLDDEIEKKLGPRVTDEFRDARKLYEALLFGERGGARGSARELGNRFLSPTDYLAGGVGTVGGAAYGAATGGDVESALTGAAKGAALAAGHKVVRERLPSVLGVASIKLSRAQWLKRIVTTQPQRLGRYSQALKDAFGSGGEQGLATTDFVLAEKDPDYREMRKAFEQETPQ